jgi:uncharacterized protein (TIGR02246 family)
MKTMTHANAIVAGVLDGWKQAIDRHDPEGVAALFTENAIFQGLRPEHSAGRQGVVDYYASQPMGLTANYTLLDVRQVGGDAITGYELVKFDFEDGLSIEGHLTTVFVRVNGSWLIDHYHVSRIG